MNNSNILNEQPEPQNDHDRQQAIDKLTEMIVNNETALLVSGGSDHVIRSRPMININDRFDGELFFIAEDGSELCKALVANPQCNISISEPSGGNFASIAGKAAVEDNPKRLELLWNDACRKWFEMEQPQSDLRLIKVDVEEAELWNENQSLGSRISSFLTGEEPVQHAKVDWSEESIDQAKKQSAASETTSPTSPSETLLSHHE